MTDLFERVLLPVASPEDARASCRALEPHLGGTSAVVVVHVIEKAGGAPDKAGLEQRQEYAEETFAAARQELDGTSVETETLYGTDVAETIFEAAAVHDATAIVITPRGGSRWIRLLTGDVALDIVTKTDRPVVVLPDVGDASDESDGSANEGTEDENNDRGEGA